LLNGDLPVFDELWQGSLNADLQNNVSTAVQIW